MTADALIEPAPVAWMAMRRPSGCYYRLCPHYRLSGDWVLLLGPWLRQGVDARATTT